MQVHLIDGTYELFRHYYALPEHLDPDGVDVGALRGVVGSMLGLLEEGATHVGVATDHVIESFRNDLWEGYKTGEGVDPVLRAQFEPLEEALRALGVAVWAEVELEADDALGVGGHGGRAGRARRPGPRVHPRQGPRPVRRRPADRAVRPPPGQVDRRGRGPHEVRRRPGVDPRLPRARGRQRRRLPRACRVGARSRPRRCCARYERIEDIPPLGRDWEVEVAGAAKLAATLDEQRDRAELFKLLATLRTDGDVGTVDDWRWTGPTPDFVGWAERLGSPNLARRAEKLAGARA